MATHSTPLLAPSPLLTAWNARSPKGMTVGELLTERQRNSPNPPPSPALSEGGFSQWASPETFQSPTFNFEAHHSAFTDESTSPGISRSGSNELGSSGGSGTRRFGGVDDGEHGGTVVFGPLVVDGEDSDDDTPLAAIRPRITSTTSRTIPHSPSSFTDDRLSVQSLAITEGFSDCSPSPSIGSVRIATATRVPGHATRRSQLSMSQSSVLSESVEDADEDEPLWDDRALARTSYVDRLPHDLALLLDESDQAAAAAAVLEQTGASSGAEEGNKAAAVQKSSSHGSELSSESWRAHLEDTVQQIVLGDPSIKPDADAMQRMKSILGPKTRLISKAPWDGTDDGPQPPLAGFASRRSLDILSSHRSTSSFDRASAAKATFKDRQKENVQPLKTSRARSFSILPSSSRSRATALGESKEQEEALKGLGLGLGLNTSLSGSDSKRSLKSLLKQSSALAESEPFTDFMSTTPPQTVRATKNSTPPAMPFPGRPTPERSESASRTPKYNRAPTPITFEIVSPTAAGSPRDSPAVQPKSAPATITLFAERQNEVSRSDSKMSLTASRSTSTNGASTPGPGTPSALSGFLASNPNSPKLGSPSYFASVPGGSTNRGTSPPAFGHKLISLEEARQVQENERAAAAARTRESTGESLSNRRGVVAPASITTSSPSPTPPAVLAAPHPPVKTLKPKKSGFLKRMMGGGDKSDRPELPSAPLPESFRSIVSDDSSSFRPSISTSASIPILSSVTPPSSLGRAGGLKVVESPSGPSGRVSFVPAPPTDQSQRVRKINAPALSLRPISMAFSAGLPTNFLAASPVNDTPVLSPSSSTPLASSVSARPITTRSSSIPLTSPPASLMSPNAPSFMSSTSTVALSLFDEPGPPSGSTTPLTPAFLSTSLSSSIGDDKSLPDRFAALQDEYVRAKKMWRAQRSELEGQVRSLQVELERQKEEKASTFPKLSEGDECERCGATVAAAVQAPVEEKVTAPESTSVIQRPRFKGNGGVGTLFGSGVVA